MADNVLPTNGKTQNTTNNQPVYKVDLKGPRGPRMGAGKHSIVILEINLKEDKNGNDYIELSYRKTDEAIVRKQNLFRIDIDIFIGMCCETFGAMTKTEDGLDAGIVPEQALAAAINRSIDIWIVAQVASNGRTYLNWRFYEPVDEQPAQQLLGDDVPF
jgi:hypothetical protein